MTALIYEPARDVPVVSRADIVVVVRGPAGFSAAMAAARNGASVCLVERYPYLGGLASGGWCWCWTTCAPARRSRCAASVRR